MGGSCRSVATILEGVCWGILIVDGPAVSFQGSRQSHGMHIGQSYLATLGVSVAALDNHKVLGASKRL